MEQRHAESDPASCYVSRESVRVDTLDRALLPLLPEDARVLLKIDTQGYEAQVLEGARSLLDRVRIVECELSLAPLYDGQPLFPEMLARLAAQGFSPAHFEAGFSERETGQSLQVDGIFVKA